jgi:integrase/recombinase XerD
MFYPSQVRVSGPLEDYAGGFVAELNAQGYKPLSVTPQLRLVAQLSEWLEAHDLQVSDLTPPVCEEFLAARRAGGTNLFTVKALAPLMVYLSGLGVSGPEPDAVQEPVEVLLQDYSRYLTGRRGLTASTAEVYVRLVRPFIASHYGPDGSGLAGLCAADISRFVLVSAPGPNCRFGQAVSDGATLRPRIPARSGIPTFAAGRRGSFGCGLAPCTITEGT